MQFETLLGSAENAGNRIAEITKFAASTPFEISELAATSKLLQTLGGDLLATGDGLRMVGDAAAISGQPIAEVGLHIGRVFNAITSGTSAGESVNRLQELGLIAGTTKIKFEELAVAQKSGRSATLSAGEAMEMLQSDLKATSGSMERLASTTEGKLSNLSDNISQLQVAMGSGINDGLRVALDKINSTLPDFSESFKKIGISIGQSISDAVNGDTEKLIAIGKFIGELIKQGLKVALVATGTEAAGQLLEGASRYTPIGFTARKIFGDEKYDTMIEKAQQYGREQIGIDAASALSSVRSSYQDTFGYGPKDAVIPGVGGTQYRYAQKGEIPSGRDPNTGFQLVQILEKIAENTSPNGKKAFGY